MESSANSSTVPHCQLSLQIKGIKTDIVISSYEDRIFVIATQIGSMGTILNARKEEGMSIHPTYEVSVIFGKRDEPMLVACARQLIEHISKSGSSKILLLSLGLKDHSAETLKTIVESVIKNRLWHKTQIDLVLRCRLNAIQSYVYTKVNKNITSQSLSQKKSKGISSSQECQEGKNNILKTRRETKGNLHMRRGPLES